MNADITTADTTPHDATTVDATTRFATRHADRCLVLSHRLQQCITHAPQLEEELALANIALDLLGQARALYSYAATRLGDGRTEDDLAFMRDADQFLSPRLVQQPNTDFAAVMVRQLLHDLWALEFWQSLTASPDPLFAGVAGKAVKETTYHVRHSSEWVVVLGDSTDEAHRRTQTALDALWPFVDQLFHCDPDTRQLADAGIVTVPGDLRPAWDARLDAVLGAATLTRPAHAAGPAGHDPGFAALIDEMQQLPRAFPGARW
jgi:ring-1,2-phenylacetyl-CoA epoxidase subunit PaaC